jgi:hypothetical protein
MTERGVPLSVRKEEECPLSPDAMGIRHPHCQDLSSIPDEVYEEAQRERQGRPFSVLFAG